MHMCMYMQSSCSFMQLATIQLCIVCYNYDCGTLINLYAYVHHAETIIIIL